MPYVSAKQRAFMHAALPKIAHKWDAETHGKLEKKRIGHAPAMKGALERKAKSYDTELEADMKPVGK